MENYPEIANLTYEQARDELINIVRALETGAAPLEETLKMWERAEALGQRCQQILSLAQQRLAAAGQPPAAQ